MVPLDDFIHTGYFHLPTRPPFLRLDFADGFLPLLAWTIFILSYLEQSRGTIVFSEKGRP